MLTFLNSFLHQRNCWQSLCRRNVRIVCSFSLEAYDTGQYQSYADVQMQVFQQFLSILCIVAAQHCHCISTDFFIEILLTALAALTLPNGRILVDSPSIRSRNSTWEVRRNYIDFERRIYWEIMTFIRRGNFDVDSTFKINIISMSSPRGFFDIVSTSNRRNFCTGCFHCIIS